MLFASAVTRRFGAAADNGAMPFLTRASPAGYPTAASDEKVKGEQWVPLWPRPASLREVEQLIGEGRAQWRGRQARTGLEFTMAAAALGVDRGVSAFRRFVIVQRLGQNPLAVPAGRVMVRRHPEERLLREPYDWIRRLRTASLPAGIASVIRRVEAEMCAAASGGGPAALRRFVIEFGRLHASVARSGAARGKVQPSAARRAADWLAALPADPELWVAAGFASLRDTRPAGEDLSVRALLTRVREHRLPNRRPQLEWARSALTGLDINSATLAQAVAEAHRRRAMNVRSSTETGTPPDRQAHGNSSTFPAGQVLPMAVVQAYMLGWLDDALIAGYLNGLLALGCAATTDATWPDTGHNRAPVHPLLAALLPFYAAAPLSIQPLARTGQDVPAPREVELSPSPSWAGRLIAGDAAGVAADALLRLRRAGCPPVMTPAGLTIMPADGARLAGALLLRVPSRARMQALTSICAVTMIRPAEPVPEGVPS